MAGLDPAIQQASVREPMKTIAPVILASLALAGCATPSGEPAAVITQPAIAAAYLPLSGHVHLGLDRAAGAMMGAFGISMLWVFD